MRKTGGFTLIELMIVIAIIVVIVAIAIPNLLRSRIQSNETSAIENIRAIVSAETTYHAANSAYTTDFNDLNNATPPFINGNWFPYKNGYLYTLTGTNTNYILNSDPEEYGTSGNRSFFCDASGVIRAALGEPANIDSAPISDR